MNTIKMWCTSATRTLFVFLMFAILLRVSTLEEAKSPASHVHHQHSSSQSSITTTTKAPIHEEHALNTENEHFDNDSKDSVGHVHGHAPHDEDQIRHDSHNHMHHSPKNADDDGTILLDQPLSDAKDIPRIATHDTSSADHSVNHMNHHDHGMDPKDHGMDPKDHGMDPKDHGMDPKDHGMDPKDHGMDPKDHGMDPKDHGMDHKDHDMDPKDHGMDHKDHDMGNMDNKHTHDNSVGGMHMDMTFHARIKEIVLFNEWDITTLGQMIASVAGIIILAMLYEGLKFLREYLFKQYITSMQFSTVAVTGESGRVTEVHKVERHRIMSLAHLLQTCLHVVQIVISYFLMLIFMTYNVWLCLAVVVGSAIGYFIFGWKKATVVDITEHCH